MCHVNDTAAAGIKDMQDKRPPDTLMPSVEYADNGHVVTKENAVTRMESARCSMRLPCVIHVVVCGMLCLIAPAATRAEGKVEVRIAEAVQELIPAIKANESLFRDLEIEYQTRYARGEQVTMPEFTKSEARTAHQITQGNLYWLDIEQHGKTGSGADTDSSNRTAYDGKTTRSWIQNRYGNLHVDRWESPLLLKPFKLVNFVGHSSVPEYLETGIAKVKSQIPDGASASETITRGPDAMFLGRQCIVLERRVVWTGMPPDPALREESMARLWICPETNYLPLKAEAYTIKEGREVVDARIQMDSVNEIEPGVFFPLQVTESVYAWVGGNDGRTPANTKVWTFGKVKLRPQYPIERFKDVSFATGALVYLLRDGQIVSSFKTGADPEEMGRILDALPPGGGMATTRMAVRATTVPQTNVAPPAPAVADPSASSAGRGLAVGSLALAIAMLCVAILLRRRHRAR